MWSSIRTREAPRHIDADAPEPATWTAIMDRTVSFLDELGDVIHPDYLAGWRELALPRDRIPTIDELNERLQPTGWRTIGVDDYVPTHAYVELIANRVFPAARFLRRREHIDHSPLPDMAHDLIGHLPMLFSSDHREYQRALARLMARADANVLDHELYEANRAMGALRSDPSSSPATIARAEWRARAVGEELARSPSELTQLGRIYLWTIEFGLLGTPDRFLISGAALLSAPGECRSILQRPETIRPYSIEAIDHDISFCDLQERYYVADGHRHLHEVLASYEKRMAG
jgi:phenylalanine-4-hydroxylase